MLMCFSVPWFYKSALKRVKAEEKGCAHCLAHGRVTVAPHNAAGAALDLGVVQGVKGLCWHIFFRERVENMLRNFERRIGTQL